ncbi:MAG: hypothetical protein IT342_24420 [Candidatus Melainabacteria bacterium]|nr:hypothetical protein [Candidatus Melainabacteria bacterium]
MTIQVKNIMGQEVIASLEATLDKLQAGDQVFFLHEQKDPISWRIRLSHPEAPHQPGYNISWITENGLFMLISPLRIDPDSYDGPDIRVLVRLVAPNAFEILSPDRVAEGAAAARLEVERALSQGSASLEKHLNCQISKYLTPA